MRRTVARIASATGGIQGRYERVGRNGSGRSTGYDPKLR